MLLNLEPIMRMKDREMYDKKRIDEILTEIQEALVIADNFSESTNTKQTLKEYKKIWMLFRKTGANLLGLTNFLLDTLEEKNKDWGSATVDME